MNEEKVLDIQAARWWAVRRECLDMRWEDKKRLVAMLMLSMGADANFVGEVALRLHRHRPRP